MPVRQRSRNSLLHAIYLPPDIAVSLPFGGRHSSWGNVEIRLYSQQHWLFSWVSIREFVRCIYRYLHT